jgi:metal-responsive CopG/Arc/MetJ family transcriptional regulator
MKTAISLPDDLFEEADALAAKLGRSRSSLYARAVREYVARHSADSVTDAIDAVIADVGTDVDAFTKEAARRVLERVEW